MTIVILENKSGIIIEFEKDWQKIEYHEGRILIYRNKKEEISIIEIEFEDEE